MITDELLDYLTRERNKTIGGLFSFTDKPTKAD